MKSYSITASAVALFTAITLPAVASVTPDVPHTMTRTLGIGAHFVAPVLVHPWSDCRICSAASPTVLTFSGASWTAGAFNNHYVELANGPGEGCWGHIVSNTASTLTVLYDFTPHSPAGRDFVIRKHVTIQEFGAGLTPFGDVITTLSGFTPQADYLYDGLDWFDAITLNVANDVPIPPDQVVVFTISNPLIHSFTARARQYKICLTLAAGWNLVPQPITAGLGSWTLNTSLLNPVTAPIVMVTPNFSGTFAPLTISWSGSPWTLGMGPASLTAGNAAAVFVAPGRKWCR